MPVWLTPRGLLVIAAVALVIGERSYSAWRKNSGRRLRKRWRESPPAGAEPDFVWLAPGPDANGMATWCGDLYEVCEEDFDPAPRPATAGAMTAEQSDALATLGETALRVSRTVPGDVQFARTVRGEGPVWRVEALTRSNDVESWDFGAESEARAFVDLLDRRIVPRSGDPGRADAAALDQAIADERSAGDTGGAPMEAR